MHRAEVLFNHRQSWDVIVVGGGITGAGVFRAMSESGLRCLLVEQRDFAFGTSSRSGKLVHGGLRYLKQGQFKTTFHSVKARERMMKQYPGLVVPQAFVIPTVQERRLMAPVIRAGLMAYDLIAGSTTHRTLDSKAVLQLSPSFRRNGTSGGFLYQDARTDDARLVLRVIQEGIARGGVALNYVAVQDILRNQAGRVVGVRVKDELQGSSVELFSELVVNATGVWADELREKVGKNKSLRKLRGSHLVFPRWRFPVHVAVNVFHPQDKRPLYVVPWEDATLVGTTDIDHEESLKDEPRITRHEGLYLLEAIREFFPDLDLGTSDVLSTFSGVRPVIHTGKRDPSKESREHVVWMDNGLVTVTGGKLTTYHLLVNDTVRLAKKWLVSNEKAGAFPVSQSEPVRFSHAHVDEEIGYKTLVSRFQSRYTAFGESFLETVDETDRKRIPGTEIAFAELRYAARHEMVIHLEDLLLRRTRIGFVLPRGGIPMLGQIRPIVQEELGWDDERFHLEVCAYESTWNQAYNPEILLNG